MLCMMTRERFLRIVFSPAYQKRFAGYHPVHPENIRNFADLKGARDQFARLGEDYAQKAPRHSGRNRWVMSNSARVLAHNVEQLDYVIQLVRSDPEAGL